MSHERGYNAHRRKSQDKLLGSKVCLVSAALASEDVETGQASQAESSPTVSYTEPCVASYSLDQPVMIPLGDEECNKAIEKIVTEYFQSNDLAEFCETLKAIDGPTRSAVGAAKFLRTSLNQDTSRHAHIVGALTVAHTRHIMSTIHIDRAFEKLICTVEDLQLDVPKAIPLLLSLLHLAIDSQIASPQLYHRLPSSFLRRVSNSVLEEYGLCGKLNEVETQDASIVALVDEIFSEHIVFESIPAVVSARVVSDAHYKVVQHLLTSATLLTNHTRELASKSLNAIYSRPLTAADSQTGFMRYIAQLEKFPDDHSYVAAKFIARAVVDDILPPNFLTELKSIHFGGERGTHALSCAFNWVFAGNGLTATLRFRKVWTGTDPLEADAQEFKETIHAAICELFDSRDLEEFIRLTRLMDMSPDQGIETVRKLVTIACERRIPVQDALIINAILALKDTNLVDEPAIECALKETVERLPDITLDIPNAHEFLAGFILVARKAQLLPSNYLSASYPATN